MPIGLLLPAAGTSSRMRGRDKLLEEVDGAPLLLRQVHAALRLDSPVLVTLPMPATDREVVLRKVNNAHLCLRQIPDAQTGISASLRAGAAWATEQNLHGLMIVLPDMPDLTAEDLQKVLALHQSHPQDVIRATDTTGGLGHPTVLPSRLLAKLHDLTGDQGARDLLAQEQIRPCPLAAKKATTDLDTPEAWAAWRAAWD